MNLRTKFICFIAMVHLLLIALTFYIFRTNKLYFLLSEVFILLSLFFSRRLYQELIEPIRLLLTGIGAIQDKDFNVKFLKTGKMEMDRLIEVYNLMIDQLRLERTRQEQQHFFLDKLIQTSPTGIIILDFDENIAKLNPTASAWLGREPHDWIGESLESSSHPLLKALHGLKTGESKMISLNGNQIYKCQKSHFIDRGFPHLFLLIEELTTEILAAEKKAYGKIIRMMAHEVNNSTGAINSILDTVIQLQFPNQEITQALRIAINRNDHLNQFMKKFADVVRLSASHREKIDLNDLIKNVCKLMQFKAEAFHIGFQYELHEKPVLILADHHQMEQVLINIIKNSIESISQKNSNGHRYIKFSLSQSPVQLTIEDNGIGISSEAELQLFSPFFTTKRDGQGIGLMVIREILMNHGFQFSLMTNDLGTTTFSIKFHEKI